MIISPAGMRHRELHVAAAALLIGAVALVLRPERLSLTGAICAAIALMVAGLPLLARLRRPERFGPVPILPLASLFYVPFFVLPPFLLDVIWPHGMPIRIYGDAPVIEGIDAASTGVTLGGVAALVAGMAVSRRGPALPIPPLPDAAPGRIAWLARLLIVAHAAFWVFPGLSAIPTLGQLHHPTGLLAGGLALAALLAGGFGRLEAVAIFCLLLPLRLVVGVTSGSLNNSLLLAASMALLLVSYRPRTLIPMAVLVALAASLYTPVQIYRFRIWNPRFESTSLVDRMAALGKAFTNPETFDVKEWWPYDDMLRSMAWPLIKRFDQSTVLAVVVSKTPGEVPPWGGATERNLLTGMIPRIFWPEKPMETIGNQFGLRYGFLLPTNRNMSVNLPWLTEFYANHLWPGILMGMALVGLVLGHLDRALNRPGMRAVDGAFAVTVLLPFLVPESNISLMIGNLPMVGLALWLTLRLALNVSIPGRS